MNDEDLGLNSLVKRNERDLVIIMMEDATEKKRRFRLKRHPLIVQLGIVFRETTCHRTVNLKDVVKFL